MNSPLDIKTLWIYIVGFYENIAEVDLLWQKVSWNSDFQQSCRLARGMKGQKCLDLAKLILIAMIIMIIMITMIILIIMIIMIIVIISI